MNGVRVMTTVICDDVRREEGGKLSFMGIYGQDILVPAFPTTLPKLCFVMTVLCEGSGAEPLKSLSFKIFNNEDVLAETRVATESLAQVAEQKRLTKDKENLRWSYTSITQLVPTNFIGPCELRARAYCNGEELRGGRWKVAQYVFPPKGAPLLAGHSSSRGPVKRLKRRTKAPPMSRN